MKTSFTLFILAISFAFNSCDKEYVCVCTNTNTGNKSYGDKIKANEFTKTANEETCKNNNNLSGGSLKDCHLE